MSKHLKNCLCSKVFHSSSTQNSPHLYQHLAMFFFITCNDWNYIAMIYNNLFIYCFLIEHTPLWRKFFHLILTTKYPRFRIKLACDKYLIRTCLEKKRIKNEVIHIYCRLHDRLFNVSPWVDIRSMDWRMTMETHHNVYSQSIVVQGKTKK